MGDESATLLTGTDEHGMKIQKAAEKAGADVQTFCNQHAQQFLALSHRANISYNRFIRTTDADHKAAVQYFWRELNQAGWIYESKHEGWYCVSDETFYPESQVHMVLEPSSGRKLHASMETGKEVEWTSEVNYHFRLSAFRDKLLEHYKNNNYFVVPEQRMNFVIKEVESGLSDLSISRPSSRLSWGIRVPDDDSQTIYVWLDALINYITMAGYPFADREAAQRLWPPDCQVIGKDIVRFHCIYWPAFLMALDLPLPKQFLTHAHWTMNDAKMSKSSGNGVNPFYAIELFDVDTMRYYMAHDGGLVDDASYDNGYIINRYKSQLQDQFGNLLGRVIRSKLWRVRDAVEHVKTRPKTKPDGARMRNSVNKVKHAMSQSNSRLASSLLMEEIFHMNAYFQKTEPWTLARSEAPEDQEKLLEIIFRAADTLRIVSILFQPFMPSKMSKALDMLGVVPERRTSQYLGMGSDLEYGTPLVDIGGARDMATMLFPPLTISDH